MEPAEGGRRTRIRKTRPDRKKRHYPSRRTNKYSGVGYPPSGGNVVESMARPRVSWDCEEPNAPLERSERSNT